MSNLLYVFLGGGIGAGLRYLVSLMYSSTSGFPWATITVNLVGCFAIGVFWEIAGRTEWIQSLLIIGVLGGFTTFSSFGLDGYKLLQQGAFTQFASYVLISNIVGLFLVYLGTQLGSSIQ